MKLDSADATVKNPSKTEIKLEIVEFNFILFNSTIVQLS